MRLENSVVSPLERTHLNVRVYLSLQGQSTLCTEMFTPQAQASANTVSQSRLMLTTVRPSRSSGTSGWGSGDMARVDAHPDEVMPRRHALCLVDAMAHPSAMAGVRDDRWR